jgi:hypothetical protein
MHESATLAVIDANVRSGEDELARENLLANLRAYDQPWVIPLWVNCLRERADLRLVCMVHRLAHLDDFLIDVVRAARGITGTQAMLSFGGRAHIARLLEVPLAVGGRHRLHAAHISLDIAAGQDRAAFEAIWHIPSHPRLKPVWLLRNYHSYDADLTMLVLASDEPAITGYVMSWIRPIPGVMDTTLSTITDWTLLATPEQLVAVAEAFFHSEREE